MIWVNEIYFEPVLARNICSLLSRFIFTIYLSLLAILLICLFFTIFSTFLSISAHFFVVVAVVLIVVSKVSARWGYRLAVGFRV